MEESNLSKKASLSSSILTSTSLWSDPSNIPIDVVINIVKRLPVKSIIRMTCITKSWHSLFTCPVFIYAHLSHINNPTYHKQHLFRSFPLHHYFFILNRRFFKDNRCLIYCPNDYSKHIVVASSDGLLCLFNFLNSGNPGVEPITLWNTYTRKAREVAVPINDDDHDILSVTFDNRGCPMLIFGFGCDYTYSTYKLIRVAYFKVTGYGSPGVGTYFQTQIYDLRLKTWKKCTDVVNMSLNVYPIRCRGWYFNGVIHWACSFHSSDDKICWTILTFNLSTEQYGEISLPKEGGDHSINQTMNIVMIPKGSKELLGVALSNTSQVLSVWVMEKYGIEESWVKFFDFNLPSEVRDDMNVVIWNDDNVICQISTLEWISYNIRSKQVTEVMPLTWAYDYSGTYMENLLLLG